MNTGFQGCGAAKNTAGAVFFSIISYHYILWLPVRTPTTASRNPHRSCILPIRVPDPAAGDVRIITFGSQTCSGQVPDILVVLSDGPVG